MPGGIAVYLCRYCGHRCEGETVPDIDAAQEEVKKLLNGNDSTLTPSFLYTFHDCRHYGEVGRGWHFGFCDFVMLRRVKDPEE